MTSEPPAAVLVSLHPEFADAVCEGKKTVELRRRFPSVAAGTRLVIYSTLPVGAVVGFATIVSVERAAVGDIWEAHQDKACISHERFIEYFEGRDQGVAVHLAEPQRIQHIDPIRVEEVLPGFRPPQSFRYLSHEVVSRLLTQD